MLKNGLLTTRPSRRRVFVIAAVCLTTLIPLRQSSAVTDSLDSTQRTIIIQSSEGLQITKQEQKAWYQKGIWPLVGFVVPSLITSTIAIVVVYLQSRRSFGALLRQRRIDFLHSSLNDFYNPLLALLEINGEIFTKTGPGVFPKEHQEREVAAQVWSEMRKKILANNNEIEKILKTKTHLIHKSDSLESYKMLLLHVAMYETFQKVQTDRYLAEFRFPKTVTDHISSVRSKVHAELRVLMEEGK